MKAQGLASVDARNCFTFSLMSALSGNSPSTLAEHCIPHLSPHFAFLMLCTERAVWRKTEQKEPGGVQAGTHCLTHESGYGVRRIHCQARACPKVSAGLQSAGIERPATATTAAAAARCRLTSPSCCAGRAKSCVLMQHWKTSMILAACLAREVRAAAAVMRE